MPTQITPTQLDALKRLRAANRAAYASMSNDDIWRAQRRANCYDALIECRATQIVACQPGPRISPPPRDTITWEELRAAFATQHDEVMTIFREHAQCYIDYGEPPMTYGDLPEFFFPRLFRGLPHRKSRAVAPPADVQAWLMGLCRERYLVLLLECLRTVSSTSGYFSSPFYHSGEVHACWVQEDRYPSDSVAVSGCAMHGAVGRAANEAEWRAETKKTWANRPITAVDRDRAMFWAMLAVDIARIRDLSWGEWGRNTYGAGRVSKAWPISDDVGKAFAWLEKLRSRGVN